MPTLTVRLRHDCITDDPENPQIIPAYDEQVDTADLSPRAAALAEAIADCGRRELSIVCETRTPYTPTRLTPEQSAAWGDRLPRSHRATDGQQHKIAQIKRMPADSVRNPIEFLETEASAIASALPDRPYWYAIGSASGMLPASTAVLRRVPSADTAADDRYLTRDDVLNWMRDAGQPMGIQAWDTLRGTGHLPAPDRFVAGRFPQWLPQTIQDYLNRPRETWTLTEVATFLGYGGAAATAAGSARKQLHRWGIAAVGRAPGRGGESLYDAGQVRAAQEHRPGQGRRRISRTN